jgi:hypothetical protein
LTVGRAAAAAGFNATAAIELLVVMLGVTVLVLDPVVASIFSLMETAATPA